MTKFARVFTTVFALLVVVLCLFTQPTEASAASITASGTCGSSLTWMLDSEGTLTISGEGAMWGYYDSSSVPWYSKRTSIKQVVIENTVTSIGMSAFEDCSSLTSVTIPESVTSIGERAFYECSSLASVTIPDSVTSIGTDAFFFCRSLKDVYITDVAAWLNISFGYGQAHPNLHGKLHILDEDGKEITELAIPNGVTSIGMSAFEDCSSLTSITIPDSVTSIGNSAFFGCTALTSITIPDSVTSIGNSAFSGCTALTSITIPESVTSIGSSTFSGCRSLPSVTIPDSVTSIGSNAFYGCSSLASITIGNSVTSIDYFAFYGCSSLANITIPESVTSIGERAFSECNSLVSVTIPDSVTDIVVGTFCYCRSLTSVTIGNSVTSIGSSAFSGCISLASVTIGNSVTSIGSNAFYGCSSLKDVYITDVAAWLNISFDNDYAHPNYYGKLHILDEDGKEITELAIPNGVTSIGNDAFWGCSSLTSIAIPESVTSIGSYAFSGCNILDVYYGGTKQQWEGLAGRPSAKYVHYSTLDLDGHWENETVASTCEEQGYIIHTCACGHSYKDTYSNALGHEMGQWETTKDATGSETGIQRRDCTRCDYFETEEIPVTGHSYVSVVTAPTCTQRGYTTHTCYCGDTYNDTYVDALGHSFTSYKSNNNATCTADGTETAKCDRCDVINTRTKEGSATGHTYTSVVTAPTCTAQGYTTHTCHCGYVYRDAFENALGHTYVDTVVKPTPIAEGYTQHTCHCGDSYKDTYVPALDMSAPKVTIIINAATGKPSLRWGNAGEGVTYEIHRATSKSGKYIKVATVAEPNWIDTSASVGKTYYYKVMSVYAEDTRFNSAFGAVVSATTKCATPELTVQAGSTGKPVLSWNKVTSAKKYEIWRSVDGAAFKKLTTVTKTTYTDTKATNGAECTYKVKALGSKSAYNGNFSEVAGCYVTCAAPTLTAKMDTAAGKPVLSWAKVTGAVKYAIYRDGELLDTITGVSYTDTTAKIDNKYSYYVVTVGKSEVFNSVASAAKSVTVTVGTPKIKGSVNDNGKPVISWNAVEDAVAYKVYRSTKSNKSYSLVKITTDLSYTDTSVAAGKTYYYKVVAVGANSESAQSAYEKVTGKCDIPALTVDAGSTGKPVLTWNKVSGAKKYEIWRSVDGGAFKKLTTVTKTTYTDTKATEGAQCVYKVKALGSKSAYNGNFSEELGCYVTCAVPTVTVKVDAATGRPTLSWKKITGATGYEIYRDGELLTTVTTLSHTDTDVEIGVKYSYQVVALGKTEVYNSAASKAATVTATCGQTKVTGKIGATGKPELTWNQVEGATNYVVYRSTSSSKNFKKIGESETTSYTDTSAKKGKTYYYRVVAVAGDISGAQSSSTGKLKATK